MADVIHSLTGSNFSEYWYTSILIPNGVVTTIKGVVFPSMAAPIILPMGINKLSDASGDIFLFGVKKFGSTSGNTGAWENPLSDDSGNALGTYSIK